MIKFCLAKYLTNYMSLIVSHSQQINIDEQFLFLYVRVLYPYFNNSRSTIRRKEKNQNRTVKYNKSITT